MAETTEDVTQRVLVLAPIGRDAQAAAQQLAAAGLTCVACSELKELCKELDHGAGAALVAEEAFSQGGTWQVDRWVARQPAWSDFPFVVLTSRYTSALAHAHRLRLLESLGNVSLLERPLAAVTLVSAIQVALRARRRQYEMQDYLMERERSAAQLEDLVRARTRQLEETNRQLRVEITERKQAESALQQAQKMEVVGQMTGGVAHDFNNLLTAVLGNLELATRRNKTDDIARFLDGATRAAQRGAKLTSQLLAFSRTQRLKREPTDLNELVTGMGDLLFRTIGATVRIETVLQKDLWPALIDSGQIELVILNLAINARDAMPGGGRLTIATANMDRTDPRRPPELPAAEYVTVSVSDTGTGMTDEVLNKVFEPFFTTKGTGSGTGLGLSQVYGIAKQSDGGVGINTTLGKGTTVAVYLPRAQGVPIRRLAEDEAVKSSRGQHATILVADDDPDVRQLTMSCLNSLGYSVLAADGGRAALEIVDSAEKIDLLLIDIAMPEMNGVDVARAILAKRPDLPIVYMSGYVGHAALDESKQQRLLKKPFTLAELAARIEESLRTNETGPNLSSNIVPIRPGSRG